MTFGSLFAGIGGFDLGLERAGMTCKWQVEIDPFCRKVLTKHWPNVPKFEDVREVGAHNLEQVDLICGGFPCQDISFAGNGAGIKGERSGLWSEYARLVSEIRPHYVLVENVPALLVRGIDRVLGDLDEIGYYSEWHCLPASAFGAPHRRDRIWILAYTNGDRNFERLPATGSGRKKLETDDSRSGERCQNARQSINDQIISTAPDRFEWWRTEPDVGRVAHGVSARVDRLHGLGNAVVPQIAEWIGRRILEAS